MEKILEKESIWYQDNLEELKRLYNGKWIAISDGKVIDTDDTERGLLEKIRNRKNNQPVYIRQVGAPLKVYRMRSPRLASRRSKK